MRIEAHHHAAHARRHARARARSRIAAVAEVESVEHADRDRGSALRGARGQEPDGSSPAGAHRPGNYHARAGQHAAQVGRIGRSARPAPAHAPSPGRGTPPSAGRPRPDRRPAPPTAGRRRPPTAAASASSVTAGQHVQRAVERYAGPREGFFRRAAVELGERDRLLDRERLAAQATAALRARHQCPAPAEIVHQRAHVGAARAAHAKRASGSSISSHSHDEITTRRGARVTSIPRRASALQALPARP